MRMNRRSFVLGSGMVSSMAFLAACGNSTAGSAAPEISATGSQKAYLQPDDWGVSVSRTIVELDHAIEPDSVDAANFVVTEEKDAFIDFETFEIGPVTTQRTILDAYTSDETGNKVDEASNFVTICMDITPAEGGATIYSMTDFATHWEDPYTLTVALAEGATLTSPDGSVTSLDASGNLDVSGAGKVCPAEDGWDFTPTFTSADGTEFHYAFFTPEDAASDKLVIWLHGGGECGTDPQIAVVGGAEVTALSSEDFQKTIGGAYVLVPQAPAGTNWCTGSEGDMNGTVQMYGANSSIYLESLFELIDAFVQANSSIDPAKILIGGCSAGGYMSVAELIAHPGYFAAGFPISEAYYSQYLSDDEIDELAKTPTWFTNAKNDSIQPDLASEAVVARLRETSAEVHYTEFEDVHDTSGRFMAKSDNPLAIDPEGDVPYQYNGHWSWIYFLNDECEEDGLSAWDWLAEQVS